MKCEACGYTVADEMSGDGAFIYIHNKVGFEIDNTNSPTGYSFYVERVPVDLYACPKCSTVKMILKPEFY